MNHLGGGYGGESEYGGGEGFGSGYGRRPKYERPSSEYESGYERPTSEYGRRPEYERPSSEYESGYQRPSSEYGSGYGRKSEYEARNPDTIQGMGGRVSMRNRVRNMGIDPAMEGPRKRTTGSPAMGDVMMRMRAMKAKNGDKNSDDEEEKKQRHEHHHRKHYDDAEFGGGTLVSHVDSDLIALNSRHVFLELVVSVSGVFGCAIWFEKNEHAPLDMST